MNASADGEEVRPVAVAVVLRAAVVVVDAEVVRPTGSWKRVIHGVRNLGDGLPVWSSARIPETGKLPPKFVDLLQRSIGLHGGWRVS
jgi:hypothetical protein